MFSGFPLFPEQASSVAADVDNLYFFLLAITAFFSLLIAGLVAFFAIRYRRRSEVELPEPITGSTKLETLWTVIPGIIVLFIFGWGAKVFLSLHRAPADAMPVYVLGKQWMWKLQHLEGQREINELHIPVGRGVKLIMSSEDVLHSFYVPAFRVKADVLPGRYTYIWFKATQPGEYHLFCAEYCGTKHSGMIGRVVVMEPAAFEAWLSGGPPEQSMTARGQSLFQSFSCHTCHRADGQGRGPALEGIFGKTVSLQSGQAVVVDDNYLRESILAPASKVVAGYQPVMPAFQGLVTQDGLAHLLAYIKSLAPRAAMLPASAPAAPAPDSQRQNSKP
ncbi:MAG: cytochrome c oxidase subunit II [Acidobacteria bacterium]|nr:cytochrome c oxidase subunit II [Acidobacteriota bacterium]